jgi:hypothetical protein
MLVDGEGSVTIDRSVYRPHLSVEMTSIIPSKMAVKWGGTICKFKDKRQLEKHGEQAKWHYEWKIRKSELLKPLLLKIKPHLILKQQQCELALQLLMILPTESDWREKRKVLAEKISKLNRPSPIDIDLKSLEGAIK